MSKKKKQGQKELWESLTESTNYHRKKDCFIHEFALSKTCLTSWKNRVIHQIVMKDNEMGFKSPAPWKNSNFLDIEIDVHMSIIDFSTKYPAI